MIKHMRLSSGSRFSSLVCALAIAMCLAADAAAACRRPAPAALPFDKGQIRDACPFSYSTSGTLCTPSGSSARAVLIKPSSTSSCPSRYSSSGAFCVADAGACHAFASSSSCPSGYGRSSPWCQSD